ncbi:MAG: hypothetical protein HQL90_09335 [Magnetococcales bacterium]|nr:hypothetical protein [Magnetococcales bacterium]
MTTTGQGCMKTIRLPTLILLLLFLAGCGSDPVDLATLDMRGGVAYIKGTLDRFDGEIVAYYPQSSEEIAEQRPPRIRQKGEFRNGLKAGVWITYGWSGEREEMPYENGKRHGKALWLYANTGKQLPTWMAGADKGVKRDQQYADDMLHGPGAWYDKDGNITKQIFYDRNQVIHTPENRMEGIPKLTTTRETFGIIDRFIEKMRSMRQH